MTTTISGCAPVTAPMTQLQIRQFQTREYNVLDKNRAMKAALNVLQDDGYIIKQAESELGFLHAVKEQETSGNGFSRFMLGSDATYDSSKTIECTVNVTIYDQKTRVRANFVSKTLNNRGGVTKSTHITDQNFYQQFFVKVDKGMFIEKGNL
jgi:hypothetical protein